MSLLSAVKTYLSTYNQLVAGAPVLVDFLGKEATQYAVIPLPGARILETHIDGGTVREFPFVIQSMESTADELERMENSGFYEALASWFDTQTNNNQLPALDAGQTATKIEATNWAFIFEQGESGTGIYQIQCRLEYDQQA